MQAAPALLCLPALRNEMPGGDDGQLGGGAGKRPMPPASTSSGIGESGASRQTASLSGDKVNEISFTGNMPPLAF